MRLAMEMVYECLKYVISYLNFILLVIFLLKMKEVRFVISDLAHRINLLEMADFARKKKARDKEID
jgi:hypothetical protein